MKQVTCHYLCSLCNRHTTQTPRKPECRVSAVLFPMDEQPSNEGDPSEMHHTPVGFLPRKFIFIKKQKFNIKVIGKE